MKLSIVMPAYNEEQRIGNTLEHYLSYFGLLKKNKKLDFELIVVLNGCRDNTLSIAQEKADRFGNVVIHNLAAAGKGLAVLEGFKDALTRNNDFIGFVDADMATMPEAFYELCCQAQWHDGVIASRYMSGARVFPQEVYFKVIGSRFFNSIIRSLFFLPYKDTQCGAKVFRAEAVELIVPHIVDKRWAFDVDLLFWCRHYKLSIKEVPTDWSDKKFSKLPVFTGGMQMLFAVIKLRFFNSLLGKILKNINARYMHHFSSSTLRVRNL